MKKNLFYILISLILASCSSLPKSIEITNPTSFDRKNEMVEIKNQEILKHFSRSSSYILKNEQNEEVSYQIIFDDNKKAEAFIFQANVKAHQKTVYHFVKGKPSPVKPKTFARFVPERKDDFAWENDLAAYRMYGPALADENPSNGVDLWLKCTDELVVDTFYYNEFNKGLSYHVDHGKGLDCYKVGHTLGAGGIAPYASDSLWIDGHFDSYKLHFSGPLRSKFTLTYDSVKVNDLFYQEDLTITVDAGSLLNKAEVIYKGKDEKMELAAGIALHDNTGNLLLNAEKGIAAYCEDAISDAQVPSGRNYVAVFVPCKIKEAKVQSLHALLISDYTVGENFTYYFGGGWNKWGYPTDNDWFNAVYQFTEKISQPLIISLK